MNLAVFELSPSSLRAKQNKTKAMNKLVNLEIGNVLINLPYKDAV